MSENNWKVLRWKGPDTPNDVDSNDPDWHADAQHPNSGRYTIGGTASDGDYVLTLTPVNTLQRATYPVVTSTTTRSTTPSTNADLAAQIVTDINAAVAADLLTGGTGIAKYIQTASNPSGALVYIQYKDPGHDFVVSTTAPGSGAWTHLDGSSQGSGNRFPCARALPFRKSDVRGDVGAVELCVFQIDSSGDILAPGSCTYSIEILGVINRKNDAGSDSWAVFSLGELTSQTPNTVHSVAMDGAHAVGCRIHTIANEDGSTDRFEVRYRQVVT